MKGNVVYLFTIELQIESPEFPDQPYDIQFNVVATDSGTAIEGVKKLVKQKGITSDGENVAAKNLGAIEIVSLKEGMRN